MVNNSYYESERYEMMAFLPDQYSNVLEVGCGVGNFTRHLPNKNEYWGVEPETEAAELAKSRLDHLLIGSYDTCQNQIPENHFDLIICNDVLEHIENHEEFLLSLQNKLTQNGVLVMSVPNVRFLPNLFELMIDWRYREAGILDKTHVRFFTYKSLIHTLSQSGWSIDKVNGINRYGNIAFGPKRIASYIGQLLLGKDTAYMQFAVRARKELGSPNS